MRSLRDMMSRMLDELSWHPSEWRTKLFGSETLWLPRADVCESDTAVTITVDIPDVDADKLSIETDDNILTVKGRTVSGREEEGRTWYRAEREVGEFQRTFELPSSAVSHDATAHVGRGVLKIEIPKKSESAAKKKIAVERED